MDNRHPTGMQTLLYFASFASSWKMSFLKTLGVRLREMYSTENFADVVNSVKQTLSVPVEIPPEVSYIFSLVNEDFFKFMLDTSLFGATDTPVNEVARPGR